MKVVSVRDIKADTWSNPEYTASLGGIIRAFGDECAKGGGETTLAKHPEDFELYHIGEWDSELGKMTMLERPERLALGSNFKK